MVDHIETYLIIACDERSNRLESATPCKLARACNNLEVQLLLSVLCRRFLFLFLLPDVSWNRPMIQRYVSVLTLFLVNLIMLSYMLSAGRVAALKEGLAFSMRFDKFIVKSRLCVRWALHSLFGCHEITNLQEKHYRPTSLTDCPLPMWNLMVTLSDIMVSKSSVDSFLTGFSCKASPRWWSFKSSAES